MKKREVENYFVLQRLCFRQAHQQVTAFVSQQKVPLLWVTLVWFVCAVLGQMPLLLARHTGAQPGMGITLLPLLVLLPGLMVYVYLILLYHNRSTDSPTWTMCEGFLAKCLDTLLSAIVAVLRMLPWFLASLAALFVPLFFLLPGGAFEAPASLSLFGLIVALPLYLVGLYVCVSYCYTSFATILSDLRGWSAVNLSVVLFQRNRGRTLLLMLLFFLCMTPGIVLDYLADLQVVGVWFKLLPLLLYTILGIYWALLMAATYQNAVQPRPEDGEGGQGLSTERTVILEAKESQHED